LTESRQKTVSIAALLLLCLLWAAATLRFDLFPRSTAGLQLSPMVHEAWTLGLFAGLGAVVALIRRTPWPQLREFAEAALVGVGLFVLPLLLTEFARPLVAESTRVGLFSLTPLFAVVLEPYFGSDAAGVQRGGFVAAIVAVAGTALVFPIEIPRSGASLLAFCAIVMSSACIAAANCRGVKACEQAHVWRGNFGTAVTVIAALCLAAVAVIVPEDRATKLPLDAWTASDLFALRLLFWLMGRMSAVRMTTRFLIAPLLANVVGLVILRPHVELQAWLGLLLIGLASGWLLFGPNEPAEGSRGTLWIE
jgi:hypothetical protein